MELEDMDRRAGFKKMSRMIKMSIQRRKTTSKADVRANTIAKEESKFKQLYKEETHD